MNIGYEDDGVLTPHHEDDTVVEPQVLETMSKMGFDPKEVEQAVRQNDYSNLMGTYLILKRRLDSKQLEGVNGSRDSLLSDRRLQGSGGMHRSSSAGQHPGAGGSSAGGGSSASGQGHGGASGAHTSGRHAQRSHSRRYR